MTGHPPVGSDDGQFSAPMASPSSLPVEVVRSTRRSKTVSADVVDGRIRVRVPAWLSAEDEARHVSALVARIQRKHRSDHIDLDARATLLAARHGLPTPHSVRWSDRQNARWGSCSVASGDIRVTRRLAEWPTWVLDYVLVHELAHLAVPDHSPAFHALVEQYPLAERAKGFLFAMGQYGRADDPDALATDPAPAEGATEPSEGVPA